MAIAPSPRRCCGLRQRSWTRGRAKDKWTAREIVHHLADSEMAAAVRLRLILAEDRPTFRARPGRVRPPAALRPASRGVARAVPLRARDDRGAAGADDAPPTGSGRRAHRGPDRSARSAGCRSTPGTRTNMPARFSSRGTPRGTRPLSRAGRAAAGAGRRPRRRAHDRISASTSLPFASVARKPIRAVEDVDRLLVVLVLVGRLPPGEAGRILLVELRQSARPPRALARSARGR